MHCTHTRAFTASKPNTGNALIDAEHSKKKPREANRGFETADDGRLIIAEPKRGRNGKSTAAAADDESDDDDENDGNAADPEMDRKLAGKKRSVADDSSDSDEEDVREAAGPSRKRVALDAQSSRSGKTGASGGSRYMAGGRGIHRPTAASVRSGATGRSMGGASVATSKAGSAYKAKKAGGDLKKGNLDPYAYIPLSRTSMNKR